MINYTNLGLGLVIATLLICVTDIIFTVMDGHVGKAQNRIYIAILSVLGIDALCEVINIQVADQITTSDRAFLTFRICQFVYFLTHTLLAPLFYYYISFVVGRSVSGRLRREDTGSTLRYVLKILPFVVIAATTVFLCLNPVFHWAWSYDENRQFHRGIGEYLVVYILSQVWIISSFILTMRSWNILSKNRKYSITICFLLVGIGIVIQLISRTMRVELLMEALGFTGVLLFIENEDDRKNVELNVYNAAAFSLDLSASIRNHIPAHVIILRGIRFNRTANTMVSSKIYRDTINNAIADYLSTKVKRTSIYSISHGRFAVVLYQKTDAEIDSLADEIAARFDRAWNIEESNVFLSSRIMVVSIPKRAKTLKDVLYISECPIPEEVQMRVFRGDDLDWIVHHAAIEAAVTKGLENGSFEVYYQPTYNIDKTLHGAEALLRMHDKELGTVYPDEFIPIAEQLGLIDELDEFVLKEVCKFICSGFPQSHGMECINVNLSILECMKDGFADHMNEIVEDAGIRKKFINFEITESVAAKDYDHLSGVIDQLKNEGFLFSIDDYGTGYSNMTALFSLGADVIKIDKSILWNAEKSDLGMTLLKTSVDMVHEMHKKSLMEGVETEAQIEILKKLGCNYLQGYYFSKPVPKDEFIRLIEQQQAVI